MMDRRHFLFAAALLLEAGALSLRVPMALAQQTSGKAEVKISELRLVVKEYVRQTSELLKKHTGVGLSPEEIKKMEEETISKMTAEGFYAYVDP